MNATADGLACKGFLEYQNPFRECSFRVPRQWSIHPVIPVRFLALVLRKSVAVEKSG